jgi:hypothetical protein
MTGSAWPFLISRSRDVDYRTVVIGEPFRGTPLVLRMASFLDVEPSTGLRRAEVEAPGVEALTVIYRVVPAQRSDELFKDAFGRTIYWIEGVALKKGAADLKDPDGVFAALHERVVEGYLAFWDGAQVPIFSSALEVDTVDHADHKDGGADTPALRGLLGRIGLPILLAILTLQTVRTLRTWAAPPNERDTTHDAGHFEDAGSLDAGRSLAP